MLSRSHRTVTSNTFIVVSDVTACTEVVEVAQPDELSWIFWTTDWLGSWSNGPARVAFS